MAQSLTVGGTASITRSPTLTRGDRMDTEMAATSSDTPMPAPAATTPTTAPTHQGAAERDPPASGRSGSGAGGSGDRVVTLTTPASRAERPRVPQGATRSRLVQEQGATAPA